MPAHGRVVRTELINPPPLTTDAILSQSSKHSFALRVLLVLLSRFALPISYLWIFTKMCGLCNQDFGSHDYLLSVATPHPLRTYPTSAVVFFLVVLG